MAESTIIVFERKPRYTPELQRQFLKDRVGVRACSSMADVERARVSTPGAVLLLELEAAPAEILQFLGGNVGRTADAPVFVAGSARMAALEWRVRELGAAEFIIEPIGGENLANLCRRHFEQTRTGAAKVTLG